MGYSRLVAKPSDTMDDPADDPAHYTADQLTTEAPNPASLDLDRMSSADLARLMSAEDQVVVAAVAAQAVAIGAAIDAIADRLREGGRLFYIGAGTSGRLGILDASECPPTFDTDPGLVQGLIAGGEAAIRSAVEGAEDDAAQAIADLTAHSLGAGDCVVGIAASGTTPYVISGVRHARAMGCLSIAITCNAGTPLAAEVEHPLVLVVGPEILAGSTRLKAGTATKMVLNMLSTGTMVRLGKTYGNLMVDLQARNTKLRARTLGLLRRLTGLSESAASALLSDCDGELKTSVVAHHLCLSPVAARARLAANQGVLRAVLPARS